MKNQNQSFHNSLKQSPSIDEKTESTDSANKNSNRYKKIFSPPNLTVFKDVIAAPSSYLQIKHEAFKSKNEIKQAQNVINRMINKENKMLMKIALTRQQANQLKIIQQDNYERYLVKLESKEKMKKEEHDQFVINRYNTYKNQEIKNEVFLQKQDEKKSIAQEAKLIQNEVKEQLKSNQTDQLAKNKEIIEKQKQFIQNLKLKVENQVQQKVNEAKERAEIQMLDTISKKKSAMKKLKRANEEEEEMIQRLQNTIESKNKQFLKLQKKLDKKGLIKSFFQRAKSQINNNRNINSVFDDSSIDSVTQNLFTANESLNKFQNTLEHQDYPSFCQSQNKKQKDFHHTLNFEQISIIEKLKKITFKESSIQESLEDKSISQIDIINQNVNEEKTKIKTKQITPKEDNFFQKTQPNFNDFKMNKGNSDTSSEHKNQQLNNEKSEQISFQKLNKIKSFELETIEEINQELQNQNLLSIKSKQKNREENFLDNEIKSKQKNREENFLDDKRMKILQNEDNLQIVLNEECISKDDTFKLKSSFEFLEENKQLQLNIDSNQTSIKFKNKDDIEVKNVVFNQTIIQSKQNIFSKTQQNSPNESQKQSPAQSKKSFQQTSQAAKMIEQLQHNFRAKSKIQHIINKNVKSQMKSYEGLTEKGKDSCHSLQDLQKETCFQGQKLNSPSKLTFKNQNQDFKLKDQFSNKFSQDLKEKINSIGNRVNQSEKSSSKFISPIKINNNKFVSPHKQSLNQAVSKFDSNSKDEIKFCQKKIDNNNFKLPEIIQKNSKENQIDQQTLQDDRIQDQIIELSRQDEKIESQDCKKNQIDIQKCKYFSQISEDNEQKQMLRYDPHLLSKQMLQVEIQNRKSSIENQIKRTQKLLTDMIIVKSKEQIFEEKLFKERKKAASALQSKTENTDKIQELKKLRNRNNSALENNSNFIIDIKLKAMIEKNFHLLVSPQNQQINLQEQTSGTISFGFQK